MKMISETGRFVHFRRKNERRLRSKYQINCKAAENGANGVFVPHPILYNVKTESVSGHFRLLVMIRTGLMEWSKHFFIDHKRVFRPRFGIMKEKSRHFGNIFIDVNFGEKNIIFAKSFKLPCKMSLRTSTGGIRGWKRERSRCASCGTGWRRTRRTKA